MPGPSVWPLLAAVFTAGFFLLLTVQAYTLSVICGILIIPSVMRWLWETDRPVEAKMVDVGAGIQLPTYVTGPSTHGWWAIVILLVVLGMVFLMEIFSYFFLMGIHPSYWTAPPRPLSLLLILAGYGGGAGMVLVGRYLLRRKGSTLWSPTTQLLFAAAAIGFGYSMDFLSWRDHGLDPTLSGQGAIVYAMLGWQGIMVAIVILMAPYLAARTSVGLVTRPRNTTFDVITLFMLYAAAQGAAGAAITRIVIGGG